MSGSRRTRRPNIFLIVLDALRADAVEPYGAASGASPTLAGLAERGVAAPKVRATASWTLPSHVAMLTGQLARGLGLGQAPGGTPAGAAPVVRAQHHRLLAEVLRGEGYETRGVTANMWCGPHAGFGTGFDRFDVLDTSRQNLLSPAFSQRVKRAWEAVRAQADDGAQQAKKVVSRWTAQLDGRPFFWFANIVECHAPYLPPRPYQGASALTRARAADEAQRYLIFESIVRAGIGIERVPAGALERMRRLYKASVQYADAWVGQVLHGLDAAGVLDDTLVIVCSDHGENLGEDGRMAHGLALDERLLHVPFIAAGPGAEGFATMLSLAELPARIADAVELSEHPWGTGLPAGLPVAQWDPYDVDGERLAELVDRWKLDDSAVRRLTTPLTCAVAEHFKLVCGAEETDELLYDLQADPCEQTPIRGDSKMREQAGERLVKLREAIHHPDVQARATVITTPDKLDPDEVTDIERRMRQMGYM